MSAPLALDPLPEPFHGEPGAAPSPAANDAPLPIEADDAQSSQALRVVNWLFDQAVGGIPPALLSARALADEYLQDSRYADDDRRVRALINWETTKNFTSGFLTGLGGIVTLPLAIPAALWASWVLQARLAAGVAAIHKHEISEDRVKTLVLLAVAGDAGKEIVKQMGIQVGNQLTRQLVMKIPGSVLLQINRQVGFRLLTKAGTTGIVNLVKWVPIAGGLIGGTVDGVTCRAVGWVAHELFRPVSSAPPNS
ncbi:MAG: EcsC family protein [Planctomycetia bacterium]|nr:EcsC family protein [Planctomycetia bacterium]